MTTAQHSRISRLLGVMGQIGPILAVILAVAAASEPVATSTIVAGDSEEGKHRDVVDINNNLPSDLSP